MRLATAGSAPSFTPVADVERIKGLSLTFFVVYGKKKSQFRKRAGLATRIKNHSKYRQTETHGQRPERRHAFA